MSKRNHDNEDTQHNKRLKQQQNQQTYIPTQAQPQQRQHPQGFSTSDRHERSHQPYYPQSGGNPFTSSSSSSSSSHRGTVGGGNRREYQQHSQSSGSSMKSTREKGYRRNEQPSQSSSHHQGGKGCVNRVEHYPHRNDQRQLDKYDRSHSSNQRDNTNEVTLHSNVYPIQTINLKASSFSATCAENTPEWEQLDEDSKLWIQRVLSYDRFKTCLFIKVKQSTNRWESKIEEFPIFEGSMIFSTTQIPSESFIFHYVRIQRKDATVVERKIPIQITIQEQHLNSIQSTILEQAHALCMSVIFKKIGMVSLGLANVEKSGNNIDGKYLVRNGVISSLIRLNNVGGFSVCLSFKHKITSTVSLLEEFKKEYDYYKRSRHGNVDFEAIADKFRGMSIVYRNNRSFVIRDVHFDMNPHSTFKRKGVDITYHDYFQEQGIPVKDLNQPLIEVMFKMRNQKKQQNFLLPQLCFISGIGKSDFRTISRKLTHKSVRDKEKYIENTVDLMCQGDAKIFSDSIGFQISKNPLCNTSTILRPPTIKNISMRGDKWDVSTSNLTEILGSRRIIRQGKEEFVDRKWVIVSQNEYLCKEFERKINSFNLPLCHEKLHLSEDELTNYNWNGIEFVFVLLESETGNYHILKKFFNCTIGIPSQFIVCESGWDKRFRNCVIQMAAKVGGLIWDVERLNTPHIICTCGIDIQRKGRNIVGSVSLSINTPMTMYHTIPFETDFQNGQQAVKTIICDCLKAFQTRNSENPRYLLIYNSGNDLLDLKKSVSELCNTYTNTKIYLMAVNQDSNVRFHWKQKENNETVFGNPRIGTVVTSMSRFGTEEFYMNSCSIPSTFGYSKPVRYEILFRSEDLISYKPIDSEMIIDTNKIIELTFRQTHLYYNWNGSVKLPACLIYAKKSTEARVLTGENPSNKILSVPFFI